MPISAAVCERFIQASGATLIVCMLLAPSWALATQCNVDGEGEFAGEKVQLVHPKELNASADIGLFKAPLAVNTDGAPTSYHPNDFLGEKLAINRLDNGISIKRWFGFSPSTEKKIEVFNTWRESGFQKVPTWFTIHWTNVIAANPDGTPCIFKQENAGYFGSLTALKNGLPAKEAGECQSKNQLDQRVIPAIVLRGGSANPLTQWGAQLGDLVVAVNPSNGKVVPAVIGDSGDGDRIGEGSVALNIALLGGHQPKNYPEAKGLDTGDLAIVVAVLQKSFDYERGLPYSAENIGKRVSSWAVTHGYKSLQGLADSANECADKL